MFDRCRAGWLGLLLSLVLPLSACEEGRTVPRHDGGDAGGAGGRGGGGAGGRGGGGGTAGGQAGAGGVGGSVTDGGAGSGGNGSGGTADGGTTGASGSGGPGGSGGLSGSGGQVGSGGAGGRGGASGTGGTAGNGGTGGAAGAAGSGTVGTGGAGGRGGTGGSGGAGGSGGRGGTGGTGCPSGTHMCPAGCLSDTTVASCGTACTPCQAPNNGTATCNAISCGFTCNSGYHSCAPNSCSSNSSIDSCGSSCNACPPPGLANGAATCNGTSCGVGCVPGYSLCLNPNGTTNSCGRTVFDFNDGTSQGWGPMPSPNNPGVVTTSTSIRRGSSGASLSYSIVLNPFAPSFEVGVKVPLCSSSSVNIRDKTVSAWVYIESTTALPSCGGLHDMSIWIENGSMKGNGASAMPVRNQWFQVTKVVTTAAGTNANQIDISLFLSCEPDWIGTVYVDDVTIGS